MRAGQGAEEIWGTQLRHGGPAPSTGNSGKCANDVPTVARPSRVLGGRGYPPLGRSTWLTGAPGGHEGESALLLLLLRRRAPGGLLGRPGNHVRRNRGRRGFPTLATSRARVCADVLWREGGRSVLSELCPYVVCMYVGMYVCTRWAMWVGMKSRLEIEDLPHPIPDPAPYSAVIYVGGAENERGAAKYS